MGRFYRGQLEVILSAACGLCRLSGDRLGDQRAIRAGARGRYGRSEPVLLPGAAAARDL